MGKGKDELDNITKTMDDNEEVKRVKTLKAKTIEPDDLL
jgi:hypothetical protein